MRLLTAFCAVSLFLSTLVTVKPDAAAGIDPASAAAVFAEAKQCSDRDGGRLWGVAIYGPMMFVDPETREIVTNRPAPEGGLKESDGVYIGHLPETVGIANTATDWAGVRWSMIEWPLPDNALMRERLLMHESFHRIQPEIGLRLSNPSNAHLDSEQGRVWLRLEWHALKKALTAGGEERKAAVRDALTFRAYRRQVFPKAATEERALEMNEGLAEYTGVRLAADSNESAIEAAVKQIESKDNAPSFVRSFAYTSGPAYGLLLDESGAKWRKGLTSDADFGAMLQSAYELTLPTGIAASATKEAAQYDGDKVFAEERSRAEEHEKALEAYRTRLVNGPVLVLPVSEHMNYSFNPNNLIPIDENNIVYPTISVRDDWGFLNVTGGALMVRTKEGEERFQVQAPSSQSSPIRGDGWTLELAPGWQLSPGPRKTDFTVIKTQ
ncbi:MAG: hypothetical protein ACREDR_08400 [Blastocatellia bacterium]